MIFRCCRPVVPGADDDLPLHAPSRPRHKPILRRPRDDMAALRRFALPFAIALLLTACQETGGRWSAPPAAETAANPAVRGEQVITGNATYLEQIMLPPGAILRVQLVDSERGDRERVDNQSADSEQSVLATARLVNVHGPSIPFALPYDPADIRADGQYGLHAIVTDASGRLLFATDTGVAVDPDHPAPVEFRMLHVDGRQLLGDVSHWQCGPMSVDAEFHQSDNTVTLAMSGRELQLPLAVSGSGARYADQQGNEFWTKGDSATLTLTGDAAGDDRQRDCTRTDRPSPWTQAAARGVGFRAVGSEPGWFVEVDRGAATELRATLDYGERKLLAPHVQPLDGDALGFSGATADGTQVVLRIRHETCRDGMSGEAFEASAKLSVGDHTYTGCGAFLLP